MGWNDSTLFSTRQPGGMVALLDRRFFPGQVIWVGNAVAGALDSSGYGYNPDTPLATLDFAIARAEADHGDVVMVLPSHAETIESVDLDVAGVTVIGLGEGRKKPVFTCDETDDTFHVIAANVKLVNLIFLCDIDNLVAMLDVDADDFTVEDCDFITTAAKEMLNAINLATTKDRLTVRRCVARQDADPAGTDGAAGTGFLYCVDSEDILIEDCRVSGFWETAVIHNKTTAAKNVHVVGGSFKQDLSTARLFILVAGATGYVDSFRGHTPNSADVALANIVGTVGTGFGLGINAGFMNDGAGAGVAMVRGDALAS